MIAIFRKTRDPFVACLMLSVAALAIRFWNLGRSGLWLDEVLTARDAMHPLTHIHEVVLASPPLFHYIVHGFQMVFGRSDFWLRVPAALFGVLLIPAIYVVTRRLVNERAALWAAAFATVSPFHLYYSQELRMYSLVALEALLSMAAWESAIRSGSRKEWITYAVVSAAGLYTHNWFGFLIAAQAGWCALESVRRRRWDRPAGLTYLAIALAYAPWIPWIEIQARRPVFGHMTPPLVSDLWATLEAFAGAKVLVGDTGVALEWVGRGLLTAASLALVGFGLRRSAFERRWLIVGCVAPILMAFAVSLAAKPIFLPSRYTLMALPAFLIVAASGAAFNRVRLQATRWLAGLWILGMIGVVLSSRTYLQKSSWKPMADWVTSLSAAQDAVMIGQLSYEWIALDYYLPATVTRVRDYGHAPGVRRLFVPLYGFPDIPKESDLGPRITTHWKMLGVQRFSHGAVVVLERKAGRGR